MWRSGEWVHTVSDLSGQQSAHGDDAQQFPDAGEEG